MIVNVLMFFFLFFFSFYMYLVYDFMIINEVFVKNMLISTITMVMMTDDGFNFLQLK